MRGRAAAGEASAQTDSEAFVWSLRQFGNSGVGETLSLSQTIMSRLEQLEQKISELDATELKAFREWFAEFDATLWERQIASDAKNGKLDPLIERALEDNQVGRSTETVNHRAAPEIQRLPDTENDPPPTQQKKTAAEAVAHIRESRKGVTLGGLRIKDLIHAGHKR